MLVREVAQGCYGKKALNRLPNASCFFRVSVINTCKYKNKYSYGV